MKRIVLWLMSTLTVLVLLFGYRTSTNAAPTAAASSAIAPATGTAPAAATSTPTTGNSITVPGTTSTGATPTGSADPATAADAGTSAATFTGDTTPTRWGDVQVAVTVTAGRITDVTVPVYPTGNQKDQQINARALPVLVQETITTQSADIDMVSGATVTSEGYLTSLQSALDQAGL